MAETWKKKEGWLSNREGPRDGPGLGYPPEEELGPWVPVQLKKGDVLVYDNYMLHRSGKNLTDTNRRALFSIFNAASDGDFHDA
jgi:ectoine hydroxylase-related dioxygenase (phytanoyl-CoA dioxygenase family)